MCVKRIKDTVNILNREENTKYFKAINRKYLTNGVLNNRITPLFQ
jgi:hypothetical protein